MNTGEMLGSYRVLGKIGEGGMGEVYRARDSRLDRDVAIKVLPELFASDPDRLARFEREAKTLAALNHPNIAQIYGSERSGNTYALVMELVEGEDLAQRLHRGAIPLDETLEIGRQIADALEAAHEQGIIHRDLKPGNVKLRPDGAVKVLDFGLAKAMTPDRQSGDQFNSPTLTSAAHLRQGYGEAGTEMGVILGTAAYMAPEQAKGKAVDRRADIWAFGVLLHEMLTGRNMWVGETASETMAQVITRDPDLGSLPAPTPPRLKTLIARCLVKDPRTRLRDIGEARLALTEIIAGDTHLAEALRAKADAPRETTHVNRLAWGIAGGMAVVAAAFAILYVRPAPAERSNVIRAALEPPAGKAFVGSLALSPDGGRLVFDAAGGDDPQPRLWIQDLSTGAATPITHTDGASRPFWSPDGREIGFFADGKLKRVDLHGTPAQTIAAVSLPRGGTWGPDGDIVFAPSFRGPLHKVNVRTGTVTQLTKPDNSENSHRWPVFVSGGRHVLFLSQTGDAGTREDTSSIDVVAIDGSDRRRLVTANSSPLYVDPGFLLFWREGVLLAQRLDPRRLQLSGEPFALAHDVAFDQNEAVLAAAAPSGPLVFIGGGATGGSTPTWVDRTGKPLKAAARKGDYLCGLTLSPDGAQLVIGSTPPGANGCDLWTFDQGRGVETPLTFGGRNEHSPVFAPDGQSILFASDFGQDTIQRVEIGGRGTPEIVVPGGTVAPQVAGGLLRDGRSLLIGAVTPGTGYDILRYDVQTKSATALVQTKFAEGTPVPSPDERWFAYTSDRSGRVEVYIEPLSGTGSVWPVSADGGELPQWRGDSRELFYFSPPDRIMSVSVLPGDTFRASAPVVLFRAAFNPRAGYAVARDGQRFIVSLSDRNTRRPMTIITDWRPRNP